LGIIRHLRPECSTTTRVWDRPLVKYLLLHLFAGEVGNEGADRLAVQGTFEQPLEEREWVTGGRDDVADSTVNDAPLKAVKVEADFPMLSDEEMKEQIFD